MVSENPRIEITTAGQENIRLRIVPGLVLAFDWRTGDFALAMPSWELAETMTDAYYMADGKRADAALVRIDRVDGTTSPGVVQMTAQRYRGLKASQVPKSERDIPLPKRVAERLNQILLDSLPG